jgi:DNA-3-methyladenine glycosylase II
VFVELPTPFDFGLTLERFRAFGDDPVNRFVDGALHRALDGREVRIAETSGGVLLSPDDEELIAPVRRLLGFGFDLPGFERFAVGEPVLAGLVERLRGLRPALAPDPFEMLVTAVTSQQISLHAALAIRRRFVERFGRRLDVAYAFPERATVAAARPEELVAEGFSRRKAEYVVALAASGLDFASLAALPDAEVVFRLSSLAGIGRWTAEWYLARHLGRPEYGRPAIWGSGRPSPRSSSVIAQPASQRFASSAPRSRRGGRSSPSTSSWARASRRRTGPWQRGWSRVARVTPPPVPHALVSGRLIGFGS